MSVLCMKTRTCLLLFTFFVGLFCFTFLWSNQESNASWDMLVSKTHKHLRDLNENPQRHKATEADLYLKRLGFYVFDEDDDDQGGQSSPLQSTGGGSLQQQSYAYNSVLSAEEISTLLPTIVVPVLKDQGVRAGKLLHSVRQHLTDYVVNFYDLGMRPHERQELAALCVNISTPSLCQVKPFLWDHYPVHVSQTKYEAYRPIIVQETLNSSGGVLYLTVNHVFRERLPSDVLKLAREKGVAAWGLRDSTSAITHSKTFSFFHTDIQLYYFHRTVRGDRFLVYNTEVVHKRFMLPWLQCTLTYRCLSPSGAQDTGCRTYRKPLYLYSGCHHYDWSVMNVVLGMLFKFNTDSYTTLSIDNNNFSYFLNDADK